MIFKPYKYGMQGFILHQFLICLDDTFQQSTVTEVKDFFNKHKDIKKWMIFSDYALYDKNKPNDVIVFSIVPYILNFEEYKKILKNLMPKDLKHTKTIGEGFVKFLNNMPILNFAFVFDKRSKLDYLNEKNIFLKWIDNAINVLEKWNEAISDGAKHYEESVKNFKVIRKELEKNSPNLSILRDINILAILTSYLATQVALTGHIDMLGWFSDRDSLLNFKNKDLSKSFAVELIHYYYHVLCISNNLHDKPELVFGIPEKEGNMWYDDFNKIPDLIAGTLADCDFNTRQNSQEKFQKVVDDFFTNTEKIKIFKIHLSKDNIHSLRMVFNKVYI